MLQLCVGRSLLVAKNACYAASRDAKKVEALAGQLPSHVSQAAATMGNTHASCNDSCVGTELLPPAHPLNCADGSLMLLLVLPISVVPSCTGSKHTGHSSRGPDEHLQPLCHTTHAFCSI